MKVLMAHMGMEIGGAETHVLELCKALSRRGVSVFVASSGGAYEAELTACGVTHIFAPLNNKRPGNMWRAYRILRRAVLDGGIRTVHAHARIPAFLCGILQKTLALRGYRFDLITTAHLNFNTALPYKLLTNWGQATLAVSDDIKPYLTDNYKVKPEQIIVTVNGVDTEKFSPGQTDAGALAELGLDAAHRRVVSISRLDADRSLAARALIQCALRLPRDVDVVIVGHGNDFERVKREADEANAKAGRRVVTLTGARTDINRMVALADVFVNVSRAALEAMAAGKPTIVAGNQGYLGIFDETKLEAAIGTNFCARGLLPTTAELLLQDLRRLFDMDPTQLNRLGAFGRRVALERYSVDRMAGDALAAYRLASPRPDVVLSGYYGFRNHGDDTLLSSIVADLRAEKPGVNVLALSKRPAETSRILNVRAVNRLNVFAIWRALKYKPLLISGGGTLIQDGTSTQSLLYYLFVINAAKRRGAKVMLYANGMGPLLREANRRRAARALENVDLITLRDGESLSLLKELGVSKPPVIVTADPAFGEPIAPKPPGNYFCVSVRAWKTLPPDFDRRMAAFCDGVWERHALEAVFVIMQPQNDEELTKRIMTQMGAPSRSATGGAVPGIIAGAAFVAAMRLHTVVYAARAAVPIIGLVYDPKVLAMTERLGQPFSMDVAETDAAALGGWADEIVRGRAMIAAEIGEQCAGLSRLAKENARLAAGLINGGEDVDG